jgi:tetratricopeptide (TPR) repeat protein
MAKANERLNLAQLAVEQVEKSLELFKVEQSADQRIVRTLTAQSLEVYGLALLKLDRLQEAKKALQESLRISQELGQRFGSVRVLDALGRVLTTEGDHSGALSLRLQALKIAKDFGNKYSIAMLLNNLCHVYTILDDYDKAIRYQQESIDISREIGHRWLTAIGLNNLGYIFLKHFADYNEAIRLYTESLSLFTVIEDQRGVVYTLHDMGVAAFDAGQFSQSHSHFLNALKTAHRSAIPESQLYVLSSMAKAYLQSGQSAYAYELCQLILTNPQSDPDAKKRANFLLEEIEFSLTEAQTQASTQSGQSAGLEQVVTELLARD